MTLKLGGNSRTTTNPNIISATTISNDTSTSLSSLLSSSQNSSSSTSNTSSTYSTTTSSSTTSSSENSNQFSVSITYAQNPIVRGDIQTIYVSVSSSTGLQISRLQTNFVITYPSGFVHKSSNVTDSNGDTSTSWKISGNADTGTFHVTVTINGQDFDSSFQVVPASSSTTSTTTTVPPPTQTTSSTTVTTTATTTTDSNVTSH